MNLKEKLILEGKTRYSGTHKWCYDFEGIKYRLEICGEFSSIKELKLSSPLANEPFTQSHARRGSLRNYDEITPCFLETTLE